jgi:hypothetical protein
MLLRLDLALTLLVVSRIAGASDRLLEFQNDSPSATQIDAYLRRKSSPLYGTGQALYTLANQYSVDPRLIVAISGAETTFGLHVCAENNSWNWFYRGSCPLSPFESYAEGLEHVTKFMRRSYINKGYTTIPLIRMKYCTGGCENWVGLTERFWDEMPVTASLTPRSLPKAPSPGSPQAAQPRKVTDQRGRILGIPIWACALLLAIIVARLMTRILRIG